LTEHIKNASLYLEDIMNKFKYTIGVLVISLLFFGCASSAGSAKNQGRHVEKAGGYSIYLPESWEAVEWPGLNYKILLGPTENNLRPNITFADEAFTGRLDAYVDLNIEALQETFDEFELIQRDEFVTLKGLKGEKLVTNTLQNEQYFQQIFYFFPGKGKQFLALCTISLESGDAYDAFFDEIIGTFEWTRK
jgi:hypothetical protein